MNSDNPKIQTLLKLGAPNNQRGWPDYLGQFGFTLEDVPALLILFTDEEINELDSNRPEVWAPLYAWRILGQLGSEEAIGTIVQSFDTLFEDDYALSELPGVIGMIGLGAVPTLTHYWRQVGKNEFSYVMAMDALCEITKHHPASRDQIVAIYIDYMHNPYISMTALNGLLMGRLMDLKATEAIDGIRHLFSLGCVDLSCAGDLEEVEMALGLRDRRSTPKPSFEQIHGFINPFESLATAFEDDEIFRTIEHYLEHYGSDESILDSSELDGFFAALACAPETIMPSSWMPLIWGGEQLAPKWESDNEFSQFSQAILAQYNCVMTDIQIRVYEPLFLENYDTDSDLMIVDEWCEGFLRGLRLWGEMPHDDMKQLEHCLFPIRHFSTAEGFDALQTMSEIEIQQLQQSIRPRLEKLYRHFRKPVISTGTPFVHSAPKVGRNAPCPCGSGKKYKKCCGLN